MEERADAALTYASLGSASTPSSRKEVAQAGRAKSSTMKNRNAMRQLWADSAPTNPAN